jgi:transposase
MRARICELSSIGYGAKKISTIHPEIPISMIKYTIRAEKQRIENNSKPRSGQPRKLTEEQRDRIYDIATHENPHISYRDLLESVDNAIKERSLRGLLREMGRRKWIQRRRPLLTPAHAAARLEWAHRYRNIDWRRVKWSDECSVERGIGARPRWTFLSPQEQIQQGDVKEYVQKGVKQMLWAAFGHKLHTGLIPLHGSVNRFQIRDLYAAILPDFLQPGDIFMHDNASSHTAHIVRDLLRELGITVMIHPAYSPDLNPIENLWALMKAEIYHQYPELEWAPDTEGTLEELIEAAKVAWHTIEQDVHVNLVDTMGHRIAATIAADGWYTKY